MYVLSFFKKVDTIQGGTLFKEMETGDRSKCDPETLCFQAYHVIC